MNLPFREQSEGWDQSQAALFMSKKLSDGDMSKCSPLHQQQLQNIVQDIQKNDSSFLKNFIRLKNKPVPEVPVRDYLDEEAEITSEPDYDNDMYDNPLLEYDVKYEPPPSQKSITRGSSSSVLMGDYIDSCRNGPKLKLRNAFKQKREFRQLTPAQTLADNNEENYISPDGKNDDDNYVDPADNPPAYCKMSDANTCHSMVHATLPTCQNSPDFYEVPDQESSFQDRMLVLPVDRVTMKTSPSTEQQATLDTEYEVCDQNDIEPAKPSSSFPPKPLQINRSAKAHIWLGLDVERRDLERRTLPRINTGRKPPPTKSLTMDRKQSKSPLPHVTLHGQTDYVESEVTEQEMDTDIHAKPWFAGECDRKTADQLLLHANKDGAFMVRMSSGQNAHQPYTLVVFYKSRVYNIPIRFIRTSQKYALGNEKKGEKYFRSVSHIIQTHRTNLLILIDSKSNSKDATRLCFPMRP
ncbi:B-cell linker protein isoform X2 [Nerophis ophidion]|uniref:B-cell linker protein isoform X2 n=1 Tax=Nerophis ophidion TaxID=159077 RepID=UPI002ADF1FCD|nr:B-cell linker protein isoform X2 [Nerophis ophidion]